VKIKQFPFNHYQTNCYLILDEESKQCALVDPCMEYDMEYLKVEQVIMNGGYTPVLLLLTHAHPDHVCGVERFVKRYGLPIITAKASDPFLKNVPNLGRMIGFPINSLDEVPRQYVNDGDVLQLGEHKIKCLATPGHCPGSLSFYLEDAEMVITGDALFRMSIGRTDLAGGDYDVLIDSIKTKLFTLPPDTMVLPGHGECSSVREEELGNPFIV